MPGDSDGRPTVLHVAEAWQGGVQAIVYDYVRAVPEARHLLLKGDREGYQVADEETAFAGVWRMPPGHLARVREVGRLYRELRPDVVHAHSSMAGGYVRLAASVPTRRIVYTPHGFAMERSDLSWYASAAVWTAERVLSRRTGIAAGSSPRETELARLLRKRQRTVYVPNVVRPRTGPGTSDSRPAIADRRRGRKTVHTEGPRVLRRRGGRGQTADAVEQLVLARRRRTCPPGAAGKGLAVTVTGWLDHHDLQRLLAQADVYAHTALWEGAPMTLLEAVGLGRPVVARRIPALESLGLPGLVDTPAELAAEAVALLKDGPSKGAEERMAELFVEHSPERQRTMLRHVYGH